MEYLRHDMIPHVRLSFLYHPTMSQAAGLVVPPSIPNIKNTGQGQTRSNSNWGPRLELSLERSSKPFASPTLINRGFHRFFSSHARSTHGQHLNLWSLPPEGRARNDSAGAVAD